MKKIIFIITCLTILTLSAFGQKTLKVTVIEIPNRIIKGLESDETGIEVRSDVPLTFDSSVDKVVKQLSNKEENGFYFYYLAFKVAKKYEGRKLTIMSHGYDYHVEPLNLKKVTIYLEVDGGALTKTCWEEYWRRGSEFFNQERYAEAKIEFSRAIDCKDLGDYADLIIQKHNDAEDAINTKSIANHYYDNEKYVEAKKEFEKLRGINPNDRFAENRIYECIELIQKQEAERKKERGVKKLFPEVRKLIYANFQSNPTLENLKYKGETNNSGRRNGLGAQLDSNNEYIWFGKFLSDGRNANIDGIFIDGKLQCEFNYRFQVGSFSNSKLSGKGRIYDENGLLIHEGEYSEDKLIFGTTYNIDNQHPTLRFEIIIDSMGYYFGETEDGVPHGKGIFILRNHDMWYGDWLDGSKYEGIEIKFDGIISRVSEFTSLTGEITFKTCWEQHRDKGNNYFANTQYAEAKGTWALALKCTDLLSNNDLEQKLELASAALNSKYVADNYFNTGKYIEAKQEYEKLYGLNPNDNHASKRIAACDSIINAKARIKSNVSVSMNDIIKGKYPHYTDIWNIKLSNKDIKNKLMVVSPALAKSFQRARTQKAFGHVILFTGLAATITGIPLMVIQRDVEKPLEDPLFRTGLIITGAGAVGTFFIGIPVLSSGTKKVDRVIHKYNNQVISRSKSKTASQLYLGIDSSGGLGLALKF